MLFCQPSQALSRSTGDIIHHFHRLSNNKVRFYCKRIFVCKIMGVPLYAKVVLIKSAVIKQRLSVVKSVTGPAALTSAM